MQHIFQKHHSGGPCAVGALPGRGSGGGATPAGGKSLAVFLPSHYPDAFSRLCLQFAIAWCGLNSCYYHIVLLVDLAVTIWNSDLVSVRAENIENLQKQVRIIQETQNLRFRDFAYIWRLNSRQQHGGCQNAYQSPRLFATPSLPLVSVQG